VRGKLTYANVVASLALFLAIGGVSYAATQLPKNSVGARQLKTNAVTAAKIKDGAITGAKLQLSSLGSVPNAEQAANATRANQAANATHADRADSATNATNADRAGSADNSARLGGVEASAFVQRLAQPGEVLTGQISERYAPNDGFLVVNGSYRSPLPPATPTPTLVYTESSTPQCPEMGKASPGVLCVYGYNVDNVDSVGTSGQFTEENRRYGFSLDVEPVTSASEGYILASWAYQVP
jgi:hypothetical protein